MPINEPKFKMIIDKNNYRANMIILGKRYKLFSVKTFKMLKKKERVYIQIIIFY